MAYRTLKERPKPENLLPTFSVRNGATLKLAFRCYYHTPMPTHDPHYHDHLHWPSEDYHPGDICQMHPPRDIPKFLCHPIMRTLHDHTPIHLIEEGYSEVTMTFEDTENDDYLDVTGWIDEEDDNIVRFHINTSFPNFSDKPKDLRFTAFVKKTSTDPVTSVITVTKDAVCHGIITVLPGHPYE